MDDERTLIDPQEHVDAIYTGATEIKTLALEFRQCNTVDDKFQDPADESEYLRLSITEANLELAAEAFIDLQTKHDDIFAALVEAEEFMSGLEGDESQTGINEKLAQIRHLIGRQENHE